MPGQLVIVESPFKARYGRRDGQENLEYTRDVCRYVSLHGDHPFASHLFGPQFLRDDDLKERAMGIATGIAWGVHANKTIVGIDRGISEGMLLGINVARTAGRPVVWLSLKTLYNDCWLPDSVDRNAWQTTRLDGEKVIMYAGVL